MELRSHRCPLQAGEARPAATRALFFVASPALKLAIVQF